MKNQLRNIIFFEIQLAPSLGYLHKIVFMQSICFFVNFLVDHVDLGSLPGAWGQHRSRETRPPDLKIRINFWT